MTIINPSQQIQHVRLPASGFKESRILFADAGFKPRIENDMLVLGAEQMVLAGFGKYSSRSYDLGVEDDVQIPLNIESADFKVSQTSPGNWQGDFIPAVSKRIRILFRLADGDGNPLRVSGGELAKRVSIGQRIRISVLKNKKALPLDIQYDKKIWSGLSWAAAELDSKYITPGSALNVQLYADPKQSEGAVVEAGIYYLDY